MVNTVTTTGLGFLSYEVGCDLYRNHVMEKPRAPTAGAAAPRLRCRVCRAGLTMDVFGSTRPGAGLACT